MTIAKYMLGNSFLGGQRQDADLKTDVMRETPRFQTFAHRSIYFDGWRAVCPFPRAADLGWSGQGRLLLTEAQLRDLDAEGWELYNLLDDPDETNDLADSQRPKLLEMIAFWYAAARKHDA